MSADHVQGVVIEHWRDTMIRSVLCCGRRTYEGGEAGDWDGNLGSRRYFVSGAMGLGVVGEAWEGDDSPSRGAEVRVADSRLLVSWRDYSGWD